MNASQATKAFNARVSILAGITRVPKRLIAPSCLTVMNSSVSVLWDTEVSPEFWRMSQLAYLPFYLFIDSGCLFKGVIVRKPLITAFWIHVKMMANAAARTVLIIANAQVDSMVNEIFHQNFLSISHFCNFFFFHFYWRRCLRTRCGWMPVQSVREQLHLSQSTGIIHLLLSTGFHG